MECSQSTDCSDIAIGLDQTEVLPRSNVHKLLLALPIPGVSPLLQICEMDWCRFDWYCLLLRGSMVSPMVETFQTAADHLRKLSSHTIKIFRSLGDSNINHGTKLYGNLAVQPPGLVYRMVSTTDMGNQRMGLVSLSIGKAFHAATLDLFTDQIQKIRFQKLTPDIRKLPHDTQHLLDPFYPKFWQFDSVSIGLCPVSLYFARVDPF